ncbi:MAG TPA: AAA family ATPase, partial [Polyangiaceae bacterium]|nr:AAA family ATPase [Polyangiaceae bacterium]
MACPGPDALARFLRGELNAVEVVPLEAHLEDCAECFDQIALAAAGMSGSVGISNAWLSSRLNSGGAGRIAGPAVGSEAAGLGGDKSFGHYVVEGILGRGGMGVVYRARDTQTGTAVALKTVRTATPDALEALRREILFLAEARHPGLVAILDHEVTQGDPWYVMELLEGGTLHDRNRAWWSTRLKNAGDSNEKARSVLPEVGAGDVREILSLYRRLCAPLDFVHHTGIVHCDLKPANVFLRGGSEPILVDFGLAIQARGAVDRESLSLSTRGRGTLPYMCPEIIQGRIPDARADLYAFGCMLYESIVGRPPFVSLQRDELLEQHLHAKVVPASERVSGVPNGIDELLLALLAKDPRDRLGDAAQVAAALDGLGATTNDRQVRSRAYLHRPQLVGREAERKTANDLVEQALLGRGSFVMISGESGIGKTFLVTEVCQRAVLRGMRVITGECEPPPGSSLSNMHAPRALSPFSGFFNLLRDECRGLDRDGVKRLLGEFPSVLAAYSPTLATLHEVIEAAAPPRLPDKSARERVLDSLRSALSQLAREQPLLIAIDDLQWADDLSLAFLESLNAAFLEPLPVLLIGTYRSEELTPALEQLNARPDIVALPLKRLGRSSMSEMVGHMLGKGPPPPALVDFVGTESEGVPFFVAEYLRSALSESSLILDYGSWKFERTSLEGGTSPVLGFPERLKELIRRRMRGLSSQALQCVEAAAVLGRELEPLVLARVLDCDVDRVHERATEAVQRGILEQTGQRFRFAHDKFREVAYEGLLTERRVALNASVACALEALFSDDAGELERRAGALARHFERGGQSDRAIEYLHLGGLRALQLSADAEALGLLSSALELDAKSPTPVPTLRRATWERGVADALAGLGRFSECEQHLSRAAALLGHPIATNNLGAVA